VDYEDIEEQYDGPEIEVKTEEDNLLPKKDYYSSNVYSSSLNKKATVFDDEDYDEEEEVANEKEMEMDKVTEKEKVGDKPLEGSYHPGKNQFVNTESRGLNLVVSLLSC
jgi:hypothetical protein